jgi:uncharacterized membrane protein YidH (DUF202 family)
MSSTQSHNTSSSSGSEITPLVAPVTGADSNGNFYFLRGESFKSANQEEGGTVEKLPYGATEDEFASRPVMAAGANNSSAARKKGFFNKLFGMKQPPFDPGPSNMTIGSLMKNRQAAIKIEPKVFFANERTFLAWLHSSVLLAGASVAIVSMSNDNLLSQLYGIVLLPLAISFLMYSMHQYGKRAQMIRRRAPGPYEDIIGPSVLAVSVMLSIVAQFSIKLYQILNGH